MEKHREAIGPPRPPLGGSLEEGGDGRTVDQIVGEEAGAEDRGGHRRGLALLQPGGGRIDDQIDPLGHLGQGTGLPADLLRRVGGGNPTGGEPVEESLGLRLGPVGQEDPGPGGGGVKEEGLAGAARAENQQAPILQGEAEGCADGRFPSRAVSAVAHEVEAVPDHGVDRARLRGARLAAVDPLEHRQFVRHGDVPARIAERAQPGDAAGKFFPGELNRHIAARHLQRVERRLLHRRGERMADGMAQHRVIRNARLRNRHRRKGINRGCRGH